MKKRQKHFHPVIESLGGCGTVARQLGINRSTTSLWAKSGLIPTKWHKQILEIAKAHGKTIDAGDWDARPLPGQ